MREHLTIAEISAIHEICLDCEDHICHWASLNIIYCLKHKTDVPMFLLDKCDKLEQFRAAPQEE